VPVEDVACLPATIPMSGIDSLKQGGLAPYQRASGISGPRKERPARQEYGISRGSRPDGLCAFVCVVSEVL